MTVIKYNTTSKIEALLTNAPGHLHIDSRHERIPV